MYVDQVRKYAKEMPFEEAVGEAVNYCINNGILSEFLSRNRTEAIEMCIFEYDEEKHMRSEREWAYNNGREDGLAEGLAEGEQRLIKLLQVLEDSGKHNDLTLAIHDTEYREKLYPDNNF